MKINCYFYLYTDNSRFPRQAESWEIIFLGHIQYILPLYLTVDMMGVDPVSAKHTGYLNLIRFRNIASRLREQICLSIVLNPGDNWDQTRFRGNGFLLQVDPDITVDPRLTFTIKLIRPRTGKGDPNILSETGRDQVIFKFKTQEKRQFEL